MIAAEMTSLERVLTTLKHKEPDRIPLFLLVTMHGARELDLTIKEYFSDSRNVAEGQLRMREKYGHDCLYGFFYASVEVEAFGGEVIYREDGPPNCGRPIIAGVNDINKLKTPAVEKTPCLKKVVKAIELMKAKVNGDVPIIGVVISPFSLPVMQMGFDRYIELMYEEAGLFRKLMDVNEEFCVRWANAQLAAGASAICYFDPVSSTTNSTREMYLKTGFETAKRVIAKIKGPVATHMASGRCIPIINDLARTGTAAVAVSALEDLAEIKNVCAGKITVIGNLNGIEMRRWTAAEAEENVKNAVAKAGKGGGFILSDNHGEIPFQVPEETLMAVSETVRKWGKYPLCWTDDYEKDMPIC